MQALNGSGTAPSMKSPRDTSLLALAATAACTCSGSLLLQSVEEVRCSYKQHLLERHTTCKTTIAVSAALENRALVAMPDWQGTESGCMRMAAVLQVAPSRSAHFGY
jgi:hypothetical protein